MPRVNDPPRKKYKDPLRGICRGLKLNQRKRSKKTQRTNYGKLNDRGRV